MRGYEVDEMVEAHCKEVGMDDLRERVGDVFFHQSSIEEMTNKIIALVDAEYRPLLVQAREALTDAREWYEHDAEEYAWPKEDVDAALAALDTRLGGKP